MIFEHFDSPHILSTKIALSSLLITMCICFAYLLQQLIKKDHF